jgi:2-keto-3-deoxy-6-phosphogluconate aldolase
MVKPPAIEKIAVAAAIAKNRLKIILPSRNFRGPHGRSAAMIGFPKLEITAISPAAVQAISRMAPAAPREGDF